MNEEIITVPIGTRRFEFRLRRYADSCSALLSVDSAEPSSSQQQGTIIGFANNRIARAGDAWAKYYSTDDLNRRKGLKKK